MTFSLRPYQASKVAEARALMSQGKKSICLVSPTGSGKCLGKGTPILMYDGRIKSVEDIRPGDRLMGPDSMPRNVLSVCSGVEMLYRVQPKKGDSYVVNASHILSLKRTREGSHSWQNNRAGDIVNIPVTEYLKKNRYFKHIHKGWRTGVEFESRELLLIDPYFLGMWLGDGAKRYTAITTGDQEIIDWIIGYASQLKLQHRIEYNSENSINIHITTGTRGGSAGKNPLVYALDRYGLRQRKHIPHAYKTASRADRLKVLAGFIDADGSLQRGGYDVVGVDEGLIDDIIFLARSLGFSAYKSPCKKTCVNNGKEGNYFRCNINGNTNEIPCLIQRKKAGERRQKKSVLVTGISVEQLDVGEYYGFEIDGDRLFMLGDFTVTHNTIIAAHIIHSALAKKRRVLFLAHRRELIDQCAEKLRALGIWDYNVVLSGHPHSRNPNAPMQIASIQTLIRREYPPADLIIIDESHHVCGGQYQTLLKNYPDSYVLGLTATPERLDGKGLDGIFHDLLEVATVPELIDSGFLVTPTCLGPSPEAAAKLKSALAKVKVRGGDYADGALGEAMDHAELVGDIVQHWQEWAPGQKTIVFAASIAHSKHIVEQFQSAGIPAAHLDGTMSTQEREGILSAWRRGDIQVTSNCQILTEGFDFPELSCCVLARPTKSVALYLQMCLDEKTEILTRRGFVGPDSILPCDEVAAMDIHSSDHKIEWTPILSITDRPIHHSESMFAIQSPSLDIRVTDAHRMVYRTKLTSVPGKTRTDWRVDTAANLHKRKTGYEIPVAGIQDAAGLPLTDAEIRFIGWVMTDGTINKKNGAIYIYQAEHQPYRVDIEKCLNDCGFKFGVDIRQPISQYNATSKRYCYSVSKGAPRGVGKHLRGWGDLEPFISKDLSPRMEDINNRQLGVLLEAMHLGDGAKQIGQDWTRRSYHISTGNKTMADRLQSLCVRRGYRCNVAIHHYNVNPLYVLHIKINQPRSVGGSSSPDRKSLQPCSSLPGERVWCVENALGTIVIRRNGKVAIVGNCGRVLRTAPGKSGALILDHAGNILEHGPPHIDRVWTLQGASKKRKVERTHACFLPGCGALFVERDAGAVWWVAATQPGIIENYRFMARKFERMDRSSPEFTQEAKLIVCPACSHAACKLCGSFIKPAGDRLICPQCQGEYSSDRQEQEEREKRQPPTSMDGDLVLLDGNGPATEKIRVKNEYNRLLNIARDKGYKRGWVWWQLKTQFSESQLRPVFPWLRSEWTKKPTSS